MRERRILYVKAKERGRERRTEGHERRILDARTASGCVSAESVTERRTVYVNTDSVCA